MRLRLVGIALVAGVVFASVVLQATPAGPDVCPRSSHLIGQVSVSSVSTTYGTSWWSLIYKGMVDYGFLTDDEQRDYLNGVFGTSYDTLEGVRAFNLQSVADGFDKNQNQFVCAYDLQGTRAYNTDPLFDYTWFAVSDDKIRK
jgi:hypothetical protein